MADVGVIEIDVDDAKFQDFLKLYNEWEARLAALPDSVKKLEEGFGEVGKPMAAILAALALQQEMFSKSLEEIKGSKEVLEKENIVIDKGNKSLRDRLKVLASIKSTIGSILKASAIVDIAALLLGGGAIWGMDKLAESAAGASKSSRGLGIKNSGEQQAFALDYNSIFADPNSMLSNVAHARSSLEDRFAFGALGISPNLRDSLDPAELGSLIAQKSHDMLQSWDGTSQWLESRGMDRFMSTEDARRLKNATPAEMHELSKQYGADAKEFAVSPKVQRDWMLFDRQLHRAGTTIENSLIRSLVSLSVPISHLSDAAARAISAFFGNPFVQHGLEVFAGWLDHLAKYFDSNDFQKDLQRWTNDIGEFVTTMINAGKTIYYWIKDHFPGWDADKVDSAIKRFDGIDQNGYNMDQESNAFRELPHSSGILSSHGAPSHFSSLEETHQLPQGLLYAVEGAESGHGVNMLSKSGAKGWFQFMDATRQDYGNFDPDDRAASANAAAKLLDHLMGKYHDVEEALAGYNWGEGNLDKDLASHGKDWIRYAPSETQGYIKKILGTSASNADPIPSGGSLDDTIRRLKSNTINPVRHVAQNRQHHIKVTVANSTGSSPIISTSQMAAPPIPKDY